MLTANQSLAAAVESQRKLVLVSDVAVETVTGMAVGKVETSVAMAVGPGVEMGVETVAGMVAGMFAGMGAGMGAGKVGGKVVGPADKEVRTLAPVQMCS